MILVSTIYIFRFNILFKAIYYYLYKMSMKYIIPLTVLVCPILGVNFPYTLNTFESTPMFQQNVIVTFNNKNIVYIKELSKILEYTEATVEFFVLSYVSNNVRVKIKTSENDLGNLTCLSSGLRKDGYHSMSLSQKSPNWYID
jgi:hypothetical protein